MIMEPYVERSNGTPANKASTRGASKKPGAKFAHKALKYDEIMRARYGVCAISPASRLLLFMTSRESVSIKEAMLEVPLSYRAFYTMLELLKAKRLISVTRDNKDGRVRRLVLGPEFKMLEEGL
jgi:hypothetical protein